MLFSLKKTIPTLLKFNFEIKYVPHLLFWVTHIIINLSVTWTKPSGNFLIWFLAQTNQIIILMLMFYVNIKILQPRFFTTKRYGIYAFYSLLVIFATFFLSLIVGQLLMQNDGKGYNFQFFLSDLMRSARFYLVSFFLGLADDWANQRQRVAEMKVETLRSEINLLRSQINPHFLFNTLNNLYALALEKSDKTPDYILKLSNMMDYMLYESSEATVPLEKDVGNLKNYIEIEKIRQVGDNKIFFDQTGIIDNQQVVPLLLLPLVENAFKHGLNKRIEGSFVRIRLHVEPTQLFFDVENNRGLDIEENKEENNKTHGIGLQNLQRRLALFYPEKHELRIEETPEIFKTHLTIDFRT